MRAGPRAPASRRRNGRAGRDPGLDAGAAVPAVAHERGHHLCGRPEHRQRALRPRACQQSARADAPGPRAGRPRDAEDDRRRARGAARRRDRQRVLAGAGQPRRVPGRRPRPAAAGQRGPAQPRPGAVRGRHAARLRRAHGLHLGRPEPAQHAAGAADRGRDGGKAHPARQRHHQGRDHPAVRGAARGGAAGVVRAVARRGAAERAATRARAPARRPVADRRARRAVRDRAAAGGHERPAGPAVVQRAGAAPLRGRRRAPAEDAAGRAAHAGRAGCATPVPRKCNPACASWSPDRSAPPAW